MVGSFRFLQVTLLGTPHLQKPNMDRSCSDQRSSMEEANKRLKEGIFHMEGLTWPSTLTEILRNHAKIKFRSSIKI